jgi:hypothetical protein
MSANWWRRALAGARHRLVLLDRLLATLVHLRHGVTHDVLACWFEVSRSTITRTVGELRPLLTERGCTVEDGTASTRLVLDRRRHLGPRGPLPAEVTRGPTAIGSRSEIRFFLHVEHGD